MINVKTLLSIGVIVATLSLSSQAALVQQDKEPVWLSGNPPNMKITKQLRRSHGGYVLQDKDGLYSKILWLRKGADLNKSAYTSSLKGDFFLIDMQSDMQQPIAKITDAESASIKFDMPDEGYYNAYYMQRYVEGGVQYIDVAKAEVLKHSCRVGHDFDINKMQPKQNKIIPLEILRLRFDDENYHTRFNSGTEILFKVLLNGEALAAADITITTEEGWVRHSQSDADGIVSFKVIQDRFKQDHKDGEKEESSRHQRPRSEQFLVSVQYKQSAVGEYNGKKYQSIVYSSTFPGAFTSPEAIYKSSAYALSFGSAGFLLLGVGTYMYRRRRIKPFKEVDLDE